MTAEVQAATERDLHDRLREPEENVADGRQALDEPHAKTEAAQQRVRPSEVSRARALQRLAAERAGRATITSTLRPGLLGRRRKRTYALG